MRYYIIAGEASGDLHGANLIKALRKRDEAAEFRVWGGNLMEAEGVYNVCHIRERAFMGFVEVIKNLFKIRTFLQLAKRDILAFKPHKLIFIDYPGFNLRIADWAFRQGFETHYYISPKVWAWNTARAGKIKKIIARMYVILPFEVDFYAGFDYKVYYVGNPLMDAIAAFKPDPLFAQQIAKEGLPAIALLPGSRKQEIDSILPVMLGAIEPYKKSHRILLAIAPDFDLAYYQKFNLQGIQCIAGKTYDLLVNSRAALVTSGTATLETALLHIPQVVCYKTGALNYRIARMVIKIRFISLVNLIAGKEVVKELIQDNLNVEKIQHELNRILSGEARNHQLKEYENLSKRIGPAGASDRVAEWVVKDLG